MPAHKKPLETTFWLSVACGPHDECWGWKASRLRSGYGKLMRNGKAILAHRAAFFLTYGWWPEVVRHSCDNPACCNPEHLLDGTQKDNIGDMDTRGRRPAGWKKPRFTGEKNLQAKLTEQSVRYIRSSNESLSSLANKFNVSMSAVSQARNRTTWISVK